MTVEQQLTSALRGIADATSAPEVDPAAIRGAAVARHRRVVTVAVATGIAAAVVALGLAAANIGNDNLTPQPAGPAPSTTLSARQRQAIDHATSAVASGTSSKKAIIVALKKEGFTAEEARYAATHNEADYRAEAIEAATLHLTRLNGPMGKGMLILELELDGFSTPNALAAVHAVNPDWNALAAKRAKQLVGWNPDDYTRSSIIDALIGEGFTAAQAAAGATGAGL